MITPAQVTWSEDGQPHSLAFDDVYFSRAGGVAECEAVFLAGNGLPEAWQGKPLFTIGETGFGSGLNFLATCHLFEQTTTTQRLRFISVEKFPLSLSDLTQVHRLLPEHLHPWAKKLQSAMPPALAGWHYLHLSERIELWLYFGEAIAGLSDLEADIAVNAWYLDGFSPAKNPQMWSQAVFFQLSRLSAEQATLSTFTAASAVRKGLTLAGFEVKKVAGFGKKRERLQAVRQQASKFQRSHRKTHIPLAGQALSMGSTIAVIGAGIAGATVANQLAQAGMLVTVYEQNEQPAQEASGNLAGIIMPVLDRQHSQYAQWYWHAWQATMRWLSAQHDDSLGKVSGVFTWQSHHQRQQELSDWANHLQMPHWLRTLSFQEALSVSDAESAQGILVHQAGWLSPAKVVSRLLDHPNITVVCDTQVTQLQAEAESRWQVNTLHQGQVLSASFSAVVVACGAGIDRLLPEWSEHLPKQKGQTTYLRLSAWQGDTPAMPWMGDGYVMPVVDGQICIGATFEKTQPLGLTEQGRLHNLQTLARALPTHDYTQLVGLNGHSAYRLMTKDHLPLVGNLVDIKAYQQGIADCVMRPDTCPDLSHTLSPNLYCSIGHGSRGLTSSFLSAELIRSLIVGEPCRVSIRLRQAVHPARTFFRDLHTLSDGSVKI